MLCFYLKSAELPLNSSLNLFSLKLVHTEGRRGSENTNELLRGMTEEIG